jgi:ligand-binding sensor domain-containing protein
LLNLTTKEGLVDNWVHNIHLVPDGTLWLSTKDGISRYDGKEFENFTTKDGLAHNNVTAIYSDPDGNMWFGT